MARSTLCIDTDILIDFLRSRGTQATLLESAVDRHICVLPSIAMYEICFGIERHGRLEDWPRLQRLFGTLEVLPFDLRAARVSAQLDVALQKRGLRLDFPDLFIAGICVANRVPLLSRNVAHFARVPRLVLVDPQELLP